MITTESVVCAFPDTDLLTRHARVEEDGILTGQPHGPVPERERRARGQPPAQSQSVSDGLAAAPRPSPEA
jgi:hypothetical protein